MRTILKRIFRPRPAKCDVIVAFDYPWEGFPPNLFCATHNVLWTPPGGCPMEGEPLP